MNLDQGLGYNRYVLFMILIMSMNYFLQYIFYFIDYMTVCLVTIQVYCMIIIIILIIMNEFFVVATV